MSKLSLLLIIITFISSSSSSSRTDAEIIKEENIRIKASYYVRVMLLNVGRLENLINKNGEDGKKYDINRIKRIICSDIGYHRGVSEILLDFDFELIDSRSKELRDPLVATSLFYKFIFNGCNSKNDSVLIRNTKIYLPEIAKELRVFLDNVSGH